MSSATGVVLEDVIITDELKRRVAPRPDLAAENATLHSLATKMARGPQVSLQALVDAALHLCDAGSAGVSILDKEANVFRWVALSGAFAKYVGGTTPENFSPCGTCLQRGAPQLYSEPARYFTYLHEASPPVFEGLVIPFQADGISGTIWIAAHDENKKLTSEDVRILTSLGQFTAATVASQHFAESTHASNERFRATFARASIGMAVTDLCGSFIETNDAYCKIVGYTREELRQLNLISLTHRDDLPHKIEQLSRLTRGEIASFIAEKRYLRKDGTLIWVKNNVSAIPDAAGKAMQIVVLSEDISERKRAEKDQQILIALAEHSPDFIGIADANQFGVFLNRAGQNLIALDEADLPKTQMLDCFAPADREFIRHDVMPALLKNGHWDGEVRLQNFETGELIPVSWNVFTIPDKSTGTPAYFACVSHDLRETKRAEAAIRGNEQFLDRLITSSRDCIKVLDLEGRLIYLSALGQEALEIDDMTPLLNTPYTDFWKNESHQAAVSAVERARSGEVGHFQGFCPTMKGAPKWWDVIVSPILGADDTPERILAISRDITDQKVAETELRKAKESAESANAAKDEFLAVLSHELRTPLTPVMLATSLVESHPDLPDELRDDVATIRRNVELESRLISDLLDVTRIAKGKLQLDFQQTDLHLVIRSAIEICQREAAARMVIGLKAKHHIVHGDSTRLQQIFWNLIINAHKFTGQGGTISIRSVDLPGGMVRVEVSDTGAGISADVLPRLFNAFEQGDVRATRKQAGLGLGLAITKKLVEAHHGQIVVRSEGIGQGATFTVDLPVMEIFVSQKPAPPPPTIDSSAPALRVLLVEDHEPTLKIMSRLLSKLGHRVTGATSVASALAATKQQQYDLLLSDLGLPDGSGLDLMSQIKEQYADKSIALTGYGMEQDISDCRKAGFTAHLTKPIDMQRLQMTIRQVVGSA